MKNPFVDKHRNQVGQQTLFGQSHSGNGVSGVPVSHGKQSVKLTHDDAGQGVGQNSPTTKYCLTSKGIDTKTVLSARNRKILLLIKDGKTSANDLASHFPLPLNTIMVELNHMVKEELISPIA